MHSLIYKLADDISSSKFWHKKFPAIFSSSVIQYGDNLYRGYITTTDRELINLILSPDGLVPAQTHSVGNIRATILHLKMSDYITFSHIINRNQEPVNHFTLEFVTPCFIKRGKYYDKLPSIERIISSVYRDWLNKGGPEGPSITDLAAWVSEHVMVDNYFLRSRTEIFKSIPLAGMTGQLKLYFTDTNPNLQSFTLSLLDFASLVGIGSKTALGFGWIKFQKK